MTETRRFSGVFCFWLQFCEEGKEKIDLEFT